MRMADTLRLCNTESCLGHSHCLALQHSPLVHHHCLLTPSVTLSVSMALKIHCEGLQNYFLLILQNDL